MARASRFNKALEELEKAVANVERAGWDDINAAYDDAPGEVDCDRDHCDDYSCNCLPDDRGAVSLVREHLTRIRMGTYDEELHGSLLEILEEIERAIGE